MPAPPLRIAVLECDTPLPVVEAKYGRYGEIFKTLLRAGADALSYPGLSASSGLELSAWDVVTAQKYPSLDDIDAILITGSKHNSFDNDPWILKLVAFTKKVLEQRRVRILGVCFGHQILGRALDAGVGRSEGGWEVSVTAMDLTKRGQEIFGRTSLASISGRYQKTELMDARLYIRCIEMPFSAIRKVWRLWRLQTSVERKQCTLQRDSSRFRAIQNLQKQL